MALPMRSLTVPGFTQLNDTLQPQSDPTQPFWVYDGYLEAGAVTNRRGWKKLGSSTVAATYSPGKYEPFEFVKTGATKVGTFAPLVAPPGVGIYLHCCAYGASLYVVGGTNGYIATSPDGVTWTQQASQFVGQTVYGLVWSGSLFVAVGAAAKVSTSPDGVTWTARTATGAAGALLMSVGFGNGLYVIGGQSGYLATSPDGVTWTQRTSSFGATNLESPVAYGAGVYVVGGASGTIASSPDGTTWTQRTSSFAGTEFVMGLTFGGGKFVAVTDAASQKIATSPDGITWTQVVGAPIGPQPFESVTYGNGLYVIVGGTTPAPVILTSPDTVTWTAQDVTAWGAGSEIFAVAFDGRARFLAVGDNGVAGRLALADLLTPGSTWVLVTDQKVYTFDTAGTLTEALTAAELTAAGVTLGGLHAIYCLNFANHLVVSDGTNKPWMWDGTPHAGITPLTNAPVAYHAPTVYYARLVFITAADRTVIQWSEVNQPNVGYVAGGYNNQWSLVQSASGQLTQILGRNEGLYYSRSNSIGVVRGAVTSTFTTDGTHDSISQGIGIADRERAFLDFGDYVWFVDQFNRPWRLASGGQPVPLFGQLQRQVESANPALAASAWTVSRPFNVGEDHSLGPIMAIVPTSPPAQGTIFFVFSAASPYVEAPVLRYNAVSGALLGREGWSGSGWANLLALGYLPTFGNASLGALLGVTNSGQLCTYGVNTSGVNNYGSDDTSASSSTALTTTIIGIAQGYGVMGEWDFDEIVVAFETDNADSNALVSVSYLTSQEHYGTLIQSAQTVTAYDASYQLKEQRARFGIKGSGAWIRVRIQITALGRVAIKGWTVKGFYTPTETVVVA